MSSFPVKWYDNRFHGIPALNGTPGSMVAILDAVLVNGFGDTNVASITVKDKKAKLILVDGVTFFKKSVVSISGFNDQRFNAEYRVLESDLGTITIDLDAPDGPLDEGNTNIVVKYAPLGWFKPYSNVSKAVYKPSVLDAKDWYFSVDDTAAQISRVNIAEDATSTENLINEAPYRSSYYWKKSYYANATAFPFAFIGDPYCLYFRTGELRADQNRNIGYLYFVGEPVTIGDSPDNFNVILLGSEDTSVPGSTRDIYEDYGCYLRDFYGHKSIITVKKGFSHGTYRWGILNNDYYYMFNNKYTFLSSENYFLSDDRRISRIPGFHLANGFRLYDNFDFFIHKDDNEYKRNFISMRTHSNRQVFFDIDGPWR